ncbi:hypothetical protein CA592_00050 [Anoxybacillus flavithermus]|nr:hypothetical protein CA592_00050 [Anoxybacillus flavithermus]
MILRLLFTAKGNIDLLRISNHIAIVGTRHPTEIGKKFARRIAEIFVDNGYGIVSGLAVGIDTEAHIGALDAKGKTIAVLAGGLHSIFPKENTNLAHRIIENGGYLYLSKQLDPQHFEPHLYKETVFKVDCL